MPEDQGQSYDKLTRQLGGDAADNEGKLPKARRDVEITEQVYFGKPCYVLKDPATLRYYRLRPPEYTIYQMLDGKVAMEDVLRRLAQRFPDEQYDAHAVMNFIVMLRGAGLLRVPGQSDTDYLLKRKAVVTRNWLQRLRQEFLFYRVPLVDPDKLLNWLYVRLGGLIFSRAAGLAAIAVLIGALALLAQNFEKIGQAQPLLSWINLLYLGPALLLIKGIHEFGHGLTAKHCGTEVHEMGILFLVFTPCFYCDVSDAWMIPEKRRRMWITAAGVVVELMLAALAVYIWALTEPKTVLNQFALNLMIAASVNTLLFNGNPLLRYDGYYFLMDWMEMPNLKQKGSGYLWYLMQRYVLGMEHAAKPADVEGREPGVLGYAVCSAVYRWFIMFAIIALVWRFLDPYGLGVIGGVMAVGAIWSSFVTPVGKFARHLFENHHRLRIRAVTAVALAALAVGAVFGILIIPVEQSVTAQCVVRPRSLHPLYVSQPGFIVADPAGSEPFIRDGQRVAAGEVLLQLHDDRLAQRVRDLDLQLQQLDLQISQARRRGDAEAQGEAAQLQARRRGLQAQHDRAVENLDRLTIRAPISGVVALLTEGPLAHLVGAWLPLQTALFAVYEDDAWEAVAAVNHRDYGLVEIGQRVEVKLWPYDDRVLTTEVVAKPPQPVWRLTSPAFSTAFGGEVATMPGGEPREALEPAENTYEIVLPLAAAGADEGLPRLRHEMAGRAKIIIEDMTLGRAFYLWLLRTLRQDLRL